MAKATYVFWKRWVSDLRFTWCAILLFSVIPSVLYGATIFSMMLLLGAVILGFPTALASLLLSKDTEWRARLFRRLLVLSAVPALMLAAIFQTDKLIPKMAAPIVKAVESFKQETDSYPESLADLSPEHLQVLPRVRISVIQPKIIFDFKDGHPFLVVPSAVGDAFSVYEYSFVEKKWSHYD
ncbi:hypothetical protein CFY91_15535 [Pseudomonas fluvialis]|uniref:Uncharacterized protein n=1 Tax=Pseudomonas fluvialis TaxID=1793966 RepID=A0ABQ2ATL4_9PSED|nr:hypothetical protein [Pseudomonas fluvialis]OXM39103.1 hypothetical protein CFY91_15535 [Pseudomonas fluvialis]GGH97251.1 hypothetical protein GCM10007363_30730 [Pseudomonas fluvialis]